MNEEVFTLTMPEAEYCLKVCELAALGTSGSDLSNTFRKLHTRLEAELHKPVNLDVSLSAEEKNELVKEVMIYSKPEEQDAVSAEKDEEKAETDMEVLMRLLQKPETAQLLKQLAAGLS